MINCAGVQETAARSARPSLLIMMFTTALWFSSLFLSRVFAGLLVRSKPSKLPLAHPSVRSRTCTIPNRIVTARSISYVAFAHPSGATKTQRILLYAVQEQARRYTVHGCSRPARTVQRERFGLEQLVSILPNKRVGCC